MTCERTSAFSSFIASISAGTARGLRIWPSEWAACLRTPASESFSAPMSTSTAVSAGLFCAVTERLLVLTRAGAVGVFLPEDDGLVLCAATGGGSRHLGLTIPGNKGLIGRAYASGEIIRSDDVLNDPNANLDVAKLLRVRSAVLHDGDYLQLGLCVYRFLAGADSEAEYREEVRRLADLVAAVTPPPGGR